MDLPTINLDDIRATLPKHGIARLTKHYNTPAIQCYVEPPIPENDIESVIARQMKVIPGNALNEFYTEETGRLWFIFLKRIPMIFEGASDEDVKEFTAGIVDPKKI